MLHMAHTHYTYITPAPVLHTTGRCCCTACCCWAFHI